MSKPNYNLAFTLAELLIALAILGVIATFTIPKILDSGSNSKFNAIGKEFASILSGAYQAYKLENTVSASTSFMDFTPYINYVRVDTTTLLDDTYALTTQSCGAANRACLVFHNGSIVRYGTASLGFGGTDITSAMPLELDPDGKVTTTGAAGTPGKSLSLLLYFNGRLVSREYTLANTYTGGGGPLGPVADHDPPWFSWSN